MRITAILTVLLAATLILVAASPQRPDKEGFAPLFNGKDLSGWRAATNWAVENGSIVLNGRSDRQEHNDNYLWTDKMYGDFVLDLEFKTVQTTNSGIFLRTPDLNDPVYTGIEVQIVTSPAPGAVSRSGGPGSRNAVGALYDLLVPKPVDIKPDVWHRATVTCKGSRITVVMDGVTTSDADLDRWTQTGKNPDGSENKFKKPLRDFARKGYIGLQDHGTPVSYRNIRIKPL